LWDRNDKKEGFFSILLKAGEVPLKAGLIEGKKSGVVGVVFKPRAR